MFTVFTTNCDFLELENDLLNCQTNLDLQIKRDQKRICLSTFSTTQFFSNKVSCGPTGRCPTSALYKGSIMST